MDDEQKLDRAVHYKKMKIIDLVADHMYMSSGNTESNAWVKLKNKIKEGK